MTDEYKKAAREKKKEDNYFDGRFWERAEDPPEHELSEEEAIEQGLEEYYAEEEENEKETEKEEEEEVEYRENKTFKPFKQKLEQQGGEDN